MKRTITVMLLATFVTLFAIPEGRAAAQSLDLEIAAPLDAPAPNLRLEEPDLDASLERSHRRALRLELAGWSLAAMSGVGMVATSLVVGLADCDEDSFCFNGPAFGLMAGAMLFGGPLLIGTIVGSIGTARRRRAQGRGEWQLSMTGTGARFEATF